MDISRVLTDLLQDKGKVTVPGLGKFSLEYVPAEIYKFTKRVVPPTYKIDFQSIYEDDKNYLINTIVKVYNLSEYEAIEAINNWVSVLKDAVNAGKLYEIENIGTFIKEDDKLLFCEAKESVLLADNFGLKTADIPLIELDEQENGKRKASVKKTTFPKHVKIGLWAAGLFILISFGLGLLYQNGYLDAPIKTMSDMFIVSSNTPNLATNDTLEGEIDANDLKRAALKYNEETKPSTETKTKTAVKPQGKRLTYYIIAGSFKTLKNAQRFEKKMFFKGYSPKTLVVDDTLFRVSVSYAKDRQKAVEEFIAITNKDPNLKIWMYTKAE